jgi:type IV pilus assembly protein PilQ
LLLAALLVACGGAQREDDARPEPDEMDLDDSPAPAAAAPPSSSSPESAAPAPQDSAPDGRAPRFRGAPIDLDVKDADLHNVLRLIAEAGGASIAVADDVKGTITLRLRRIPWDQALDTVIRMEKLHLERDGDVYLITR